MILKYINHLNEEIDLSAPPYLLTESEAFNYNWDFETIKPGSRRSIIKNFKRHSKTFPADLFIKSTDFKEDMNNFFEIIEKDVLAEKPGKLVRETGEYLVCYIFEARNESFHIKNGYCKKKVNIVSPHPFWIKEVSRDFFPQKKQESDNLDYPYNYDYDYAPSSGAQIWNIDHYAASEFQLTIFGPAVDPLVNINGHTYQVYDTLDSTDYIVVDSRDHTIKKHKTDGTQVNLYDMRAKESSVFELIPAGRLAFNWSGTFGFNLRLFLERSEPEW